MINIKDCNEIAIIRTDRIGDMILTLPMCLALKSEFPNSHISVIANSYTKDLLENSPALDKCFFIDKDENGIIGIFKRNKFDAVFFPRPKFDEAFAAFKARIPLRIGTAFRWYSILFNVKIKEHRKISLFHEAEYNVRMVSKAIGKDLETKLVPPFIETDSLLKVKNILTENKIDLNKKIIIIHPGSRGSARDLSPEQFGKIAKILSDSINSEIIITGTASEKVACETVSNSCQSLKNLCSLFNLKELIALISISDTLIANSTGILHIAAALGKNVIGFYPNTPHISAKRWGPYTQNKLIFTPEDGSDRMEKINHEKAGFEIVNWLN